MVIVELYGGGLRFSPTVKEKATRGSRQDYIAIAEYRAGTITRKETARRLHCTLDFMDEFIRMVTEDWNEFDQERDDQMRKYGYIISGDDRCVDREYTGRRCI